jgi:hypothetical protein
VGSTSLTGLGLLAMVLTHMVACFLVFTVAELGGAAGLDSRFFGLAVFLVVEAFGCLGAFVNGS